MSHIHGETNIITHGVSGVVHVKLIWMYRKREYIPYIVGRLLQGSGEVDVIFHSEILVCCFVSASRLDPAPHKCWEQENISHALSEGCCMDSGRYILYLTERWWCVGLCGISALSCVHQNQPHYTYNWSGRFIHSLTNPWLWVI